MRRRGKVHSSGPAGAVKLVPSEPPARASPAASPRAKVILTEAEETLLRGGRAELNPRRSPGRSAGVAGTARLAAKDATKLKGR